MWRVVSNTMKYSAALRRLSDGETTMNDFDNEILPTDPDEGEEITERVAGRETYEWVRSLVGAVLVITLLFTFVVRLMGVDGHSMVQDTFIGIHFTTKKYKKQQDLQRPA